MTPRYIRIFLIHTPLVLLDRSLETTKIVVVKTALHLTKSAAGVGRTPGNRICWYRDRGILCGSFDIICRRHRHRTQNPVIVSTTSYYRDQNIYFEVYGLSNVIRRRYR